MLLFLCRAGAAGGEEAAVPDSDALAPLLRVLLQVAEQLGGYEASVPLPTVRWLPQHVLEAKVCDEPCNVTAAYIPGDGIYLSHHLDPEHDLHDRATLLHELVHHLQQGHPRFATLKGCSRERAKEAEAYAIQNAYVAGAGSVQRWTFFEGEFDCARPAEETDR